MKENYYFDNAATTLPKPEPVYQFIDKFYRSHGVNPGRSGHQLAVEAEAMIVQTRRMLGEFFGYAGDPARVTFSQNATDSMNAALAGILNPGDHLVITQWNITAYYDLPITWREIMALKSPGWQQIVKGM